MLARTVASCLVLGGQGIQKVCADWKIEQSFIGRKIRKICGRIIPDDQTRLGFETQFLDPGCQTSLYPNVATAMTFAHYVKYSFSKNPFVVFSKFPSNSSKMLAFLVYFQNRSCKSGYILRRKFRKVRFFRIVGDHSNFFAIC